MPAIDKKVSLVKNTSYQVVLPFYIYAALSFLVGCLLLLTSSAAFTQHYFHPQTLAVTHTMALGWGTMMILGAGHQLLPVLIEGRLYSNALAWLSFIFAGTGIPLLVAGFYTFNMGWPAQSGGIFINAAVVCYLINIGVSLVKSKHENVHAVFVFTATLWLLLTTLFGLLLVYNFSLHIFSKSSLEYLSLHAHLGIAGWFLLMVMGVGSRLIPMFLISKFSNAKWLWVIYALVNTGLISFMILHIYLPRPTLYLFPVATMVSALLLFAWYCRKAFVQRIRKQVDDQLKISLLSVLMMVLPLIVLIITLILLVSGKDNSRMVLLYGFSIFFGWITAIIFGMTFKTLPFIIWNKVYHVKAGLGKTPNPKELFNSKIFAAMGIAYLTGFVLFATGIIFFGMMVLKIAALLLLVAAILYNWNVFKIILHKPLKP